MLLKFTLLVFPIILFKTLFAQNREINFEKGTWQEVLEKAKKENKLVFLDAFTSWCGPCKWIAQNVFKNDTVADFYNANFINYKVDMEKGIGPELGKKYRVYAYPNLLYINANGELVHRRCGAVKTADFIQLGKDALDPAKQFAQIEKGYEANKNNPTYLKNYLAVLASSCLKTDDVASQFFSNFSEKELFSEENWRLIKKFSNNINSREFNFVESHLQEYINLYGQEEVEDYLGRVYSEELYIRLQKNMKEYDDLKNRLKKSSLSKKDLILKQVELERLLMEEKYFEYGKLALEVLAGTKNNETDFVNNLAWNFYEKIEDKETLQKIIPYVEEACKKEPSYAIFDTHAALLTKLKSPKAKEWINKAIEQGKLEGADVSETEKLKQNLK